MQTILLLVSVVFIVPNCRCKGLTTEGNMVDQGLVSVVALMRHGDRTPYVSFPNDRYFDLSHWPMGHGQLTNKGKDRAYQLGKWLRNRYDSFLSQEYKPSEIYVRSTDVDRCLVSASVTLASLYPVRDSRGWNLKKLWQPIPIHTKPFPEDEILGMMTQSDHYTQLYEETMQNDYFRNITSKYSDLFSFVSEQTGWETVGLDEIKTLQTIFDIYASFNKSFLPDWYHDLDKEVILNLAAIKHESFTHTTELKRLVTGRFWATLFDYFDKIISESKLPKFMLLTAHDTTMIALLNSMGVFDFVPPVFGATLIWELRRDGADYYVDVLYKREGSNPQVLKLKRGEEYCEYGKFKEVLEPVTVDVATWEEERMGPGFQDELRVAEGRLKKFWLSRAKKRNSQPFFVT